MEPNKELIESRAQEYADQYVERFQKVAKQAYIDGVMAVLRDVLKD